MRNRSIEIWMRESKIPSCPLTGTGGHQTQLNSSVNFSDGLGEVA